MYISINNSSRWLVIIRKNTLVAFEEQIKDENS